MDSYVLYAPGGATSIQLGSWLQPDPGPDFGAAGLIKAQFVDTPFSEGALQFEDVGPRSMMFPLIIGSNAAWGGQRQAETVLRQFARPGAYIDLQPEGVPSSESVRFDVLTGRWEPAYTVGVNRAGRRIGALRLDTGPYGYWPTTILLASVLGATGFPFSLAIPAGSILGDAPALARISFSASTPTTWNGGAPSAQTWDYDGFWYSTERVGGQAFLTPSDFVVATSQNTNATIAVWGFPVASDSSGPFGSKLKAVIGPALNGGGGATWGRWAQLLLAPSAFYDANNSVPSYFRGRWHVYAALRLSPSMGVPWLVTSDEALGDLDQARPIASAYPIATMLPQANPSYADSPTSTFQYVDLGEHLFPPVSGSGGDGFTFRIWAFAGPSGLPSVGTAAVELGGLFMQKMGPGAGVMGKGYAYPTTNNIIATGAFGNLQGYYTPIGVGGRMVLDGIGGRIAGVFGSPPMQIADMRARFNGPMPRLSPTAVNLDIGFFHRRVSVPGATNIAALAGPVIVSGSVEYRPRFQFLKGL